MTIAFNIGPDTFLEDPFSGPFLDAYPWREMASLIETDSPLLARFSHLELQKRWLEGLAGISVIDDRIIAYTSLVKVPIIRTIKPKFDVFEASSGWTAPEYRRRSYQVRMRRRLYESRPNDLLVSFCVGVGASFVHAKLNWTLFSWPDYLGISDFIGKIKGGYLYHRLGDQIDLGGRIPFEKDSSFSMATHDWDKYLHLWVSDSSMAESLKNCFST